MVSVDDHKSKEGDIKEGVFYCSCSVPEIKEGTLGGIVCFTATPIATCLGILYRPIEINSRMIILDDQARNQMTCHF